MQELKNKILEFVSKKGPILPIKVSQEFRTSTLMASAILSELVSQKKVKLTNAKIGSSPVYYISGQEFKLSVLHPHLNQREREAYDLLQKKRVLRDTEVKPYERVALRAIKDFAVPIPVKINEQEELFWRWYLFPENAAKDLIKQVAETEEVEPTVIGQNKQIEQGRVETLPQEEERKPTHQATRTKKREIITELQKQLIIEKREKIKYLSEFEELLLEFFNKNEFRVIEKTTIRKNTDHEFILFIPSKIGNIKCFAKAKAKTKISDADLSLAASSAKIKNLPLLFLTKGELTKKAQTFIEQNNILFKRL